MRTVRSAAAQRAHEEAMAKVREILEERRRETERLVEDLKVQVERFAALRKRVVKSASPNTWEVLDAEGTRCIALANSVREGIAAARRYDARVAKSEADRRVAVSKRKQRLDEEAQARAAAARRIREAAEERVQAERDAREIDATAKYVQAEAAVTTAKAIKQLSADVADLAANLAGAGVMKNSAPTPTRKRVKKTVVRDKSGRIVEVIEDQREDGI